MEMISKILIFIVLAVFLPIEMIGQDHPNEYYAKKFLKRYEYLEQRFIDISNERLLRFIEADSILKKNFLEGDSTNFKKLKINIQPILKFTEEAEEFKNYQNIFDFVVFDTVDYHCLAKYYLADSLCFYISRGHNDCDKGYWTFGSDIDWCKGEYFFMQLFYNRDIDKSCYGPPFQLIINYQKELIFYIDFVTYPLMISDNHISLYPLSNDKKFLKLAKKPQMYIKDKYEAEWIRHCAKNCPVGGKTPWWKFWEW